MFSSQACSALHSHQKLSPCRWSSSGPSLTGTRGSTTLGKKRYFKNSVLQYIYYLMI
jgi:hypothetical protein